MEALDHTYGVFDDFMSGIGAKVGVPGDQLKFLACLLLQIPVAFVFRELVNRSGPVDGKKGAAVPAYLHVIAGSLGLAMLVVLLGPYQWLHSAVSAAVAYALMAALPARQCGRAVFVFAMAYVSISHLYRMYQDWMGWSLDFTGPQMVLTIKLTSLAFAYSDRDRPDSELWRQQQELRIRQLPSPVEYFGFIYFFPGVLAGPAFELAAYRDYLTRRQFPTGRVPSSAAAAGKQFLWALWAVAVMQVGSHFFPMSLLIDEQRLATMSWLEVYVTMLVAPAVVRFRYYFGWFLAEVSFVACGFGYQRKSDGTEDWERLENVYPLGVELPQNFKSVTDSWNRGTATWLRNYVYFRNVPPNGKPGEFVTLLTFVQSAFWHGFYPGYYLFFVFAALQVIVQRQWRNRIRPYVLQNPWDPAAKQRGKPGLKLLYDIGSTIATLTMTDWSGCAFLLLSLPRALVVWRATYYVGLWVLLAGFAIAAIVPPLKQKPVAAAAAAAGATPAAAGGSKPSKAE